MNLDAELEHKDESFYEEFDEAVSNQLVLLMTNRDKRKIISVVKTWNKVNKYREKKFGKVNYEGVSDEELKKKKRKLFAVMTAVKTAGVFVKPAKITDILNYKITK